ncbi:MAG: hypothetical protein OSA78_00825 [Flavobacteriales bacterium]|nr:hypothetical protein [Flavobacteriales bacterium]
MTSVISNFHNHLRGVFCLVGMLVLCIPSWGQFTVERSPWLDGPEITDQPTLDSVE